MQLPNYRHLSALTLLTLIFGLLAAQPYQKIHAYDLGAGPITGTYFDVTNLSSAAPIAGSSVAIGHSLAGPQNGILMEILTNGDANASYEFSYPGGGPVMAEAICNTPNDEVIACFFDPTNLATDVVRFSTAAGVIWSRRLPSFHAQDVVCDSANAAGGIGIWLTGESTVSQRLVIEGLTGAGAPVFATDYALNNPNWGYQSTTGFQIKLNSNRTRLVVVGNAVITGAAQSEMLVMKTTLGGNVIWAKGYGDPNGNDYYHGKCLSMRSPTSSRIIVGFEYSNTGMPLDEAAAMTIDGLGNPLWIEAYPGGGFFAGSDYVVEDLDILNNRILLAGYFTPTANGGTSAYSLALRPNGVADQFNEYETAGLYPTADATFHGMEYNAVTNQHVIVGRYTTSVPGPAVGWPWNGIADAFWAVSTNRLGIANCSTPGNVDGYPLTPVVANLGSNLGNMPQPQQSPLGLQTADPKSDIQCGALKGNTESILDEVESLESISVDIAYLNVEGQIRVDVQSEAAGEFTCELLNLQGQVLAERSGNADSYTFDVSQLSKGVYMIRYAGNDRHQGVQKIMIW